MAVRSSKASTSLCRINILFPTRLALSSPEAIMAATLPRLNPRIRQALSIEWTNGGQLSSTLARDTGLSFGDRVVKRISHEFKKHITPKYASLQLGVRRFTHNVGMCIWPDPISNDLTGFSPFV
jgi:hypothetical protein